MKLINRTGIVLAVAAGAAIAGPAIAQDQAQDQTEPEATVLDRILVTAGEDKVAIETPQAVSVVDQEDLENAQPDTIGDAIEDLPGVATTGSERIVGESFNIRGVGSALSADEPRLIVNVDGTPKYYEQYRMGSFFSDPELYKRIEVLRGPASSTLYGSGALAGVINLETKDPEDFLTDEKSWALRQKFGVTANAGGFGFLSSSIGAWRPTEGASFLLNGLYREGPEYKDGSGASVDGSDFETFSGLAKGVFTFGPDDAHRLELSYSRFETELNDAPYSQTGLSNGDFNVFGTADRDIVDQTATASWNYAPLDNPYLDLTITGSYANSRSKQSDLKGGQEIFPGGPTVAQLSFGDEWANEYETLQLRVENTADLSGGNWENFLTTGVQIAHQDRTAEATYLGAPFDVSSSQPEGEQLGLGGYMQLESVYDGWLTVIPGVRVDQISTEAGDSVPASVTSRSHDFTLFSPKLAAHAQATDWLGLFGSVAHTERAPVIDELYDSDNYATSLIGDPKKETSNNYELGFALSFNGVLTDADAFRIKTTAFYNDIDDMIRSVGTGVIGADGREISVYANDAGAKLHGVEIEAAYDAGFAFGRLGYSLIRGELDNGDYLDSVPADELTLTLGGRLQEEGLEFGWKGTFAAGQEKVSDPSATSFGAGSPTAGYMIHDIYASWKPQEGLFQEGLFQEGLFKDTEFRAGVENIFDKTYRPHLSGDTAPGMTAKFSVSRAF